MPTGLDNLSVHVSGSMMKMFALRGRYIMGGARGVDNNSSKHKTISAGWKSNWESPVRLQFRKSTLLGEKTTTIFRLVRRVLAYVCVCASHHFVLCSLDQTQQQVGAENCNQLRLMV